MDQEQKDKIIKMAKVLGPSYIDNVRNSAEEANKKIDRIASLLIIIAFSSVGLSVQLLQNKNLDTKIIKWGLIFLIFSVICGFAQLITDNIYWSKRVEPNRDIATNFALISTEEFNENNINSVRETLNQLKKMPNNSSIIPLILDFTFVVIGELMLISQLFFKTL